MVEAGLLDDERVELLHGELVAMSPQGSLHSEVAHRLVERLLVPLQGRARVRGHSPLAATESSEPEPDVSVVPCADFSHGHPGRAFLVIEVANTSLATDRGIKASVYAESGVPEYWIVNLVERVIEVHREPQEGKSRVVDTKRRGDTIALAHFPDVELAVADIVG